MLCLHVNGTYFSYNVTVYYFVLSKSTYGIKAFHCFIIQMYLAALHPLPFVYPGTHFWEAFFFLPFSLCYVWIPSCRLWCMYHFGLAVGWVRLMTCSKCLSPSQATKAKLLNGNVMRFKASAAAVKVESPGNRANPNPTVQHMRPNCI